jgi:hypothetical protein
VCFCTAGVRARAALHLSEQSWQAARLGGWGQTQDFWVSYDGGQTWQDSDVPYLANQSMHYSFKGGPGISAVAQVAYIPNR